MRQPLLAGPLGLVLLGLTASTSAAASPEVTPRLFLHIRPEIRTNPSFIAGQEDTVYSVSQSAFVGLDAKSGSFRGVVDIQGTESWGTRASSTSTSPTVYPFQAFLQAGTGKHWVRFGRQMLHLHNGWHMSKAPWNIAGRSFDGVRAHVEPGQWEVDAFALLVAAPFARTTVEVSVDGDPTTVGPSLGETHAGIYATWKASDDLELAPLLLSRFGGPTLDDPDRSLWWVSPGFRFYATPDQTSVDLVVFGQVGDLSNTPIRAYSAILRARQGLGNSPLKPGVGVIFEQDSGSACTTDTECAPDTINDFQTGFGRNHFLRGNADQFRGINLRDMGLEVDSTPWTGKGKRSLNLAIQGHFFQMVNPEGVWLNGFGAVQGTGWEVGNTDPNLAWEVDALMDLHLTEVAQIDGGLCIVQPVGHGARLTGNAPMTYAFARNRFTF